MAQEEIEYDIPSKGNGANNGRAVDLIVTYDPTAPNADGSYTVTGASGTYETIGDDGKVIDTDTITGISAINANGANDNRLFVVDDPTTTPVVNYNGITFTIDNPSDANDTAGNVNFFDLSGPKDQSAPTDTPNYQENSQNHSSGNVITENALCYVSGTLISTDRGDIAVEALVVGDIVRTACGGQRPIRWLGHRTVDCRDPVLSRDVAPVRVSAHAFGDNLPGRDLYLSPGHPVLVDADDDHEGGHLVPIMCLINGTTIDRVAMDQVAYWHVELDEHDILLAEGLPAESYIDLGSRAWFDGANGGLDDPDLARPGMPGRCRPVAIDGPAVEAERRRLDTVFASQLSAACGWPEYAAVFPKAPG